MMFNEGQTSVFQCGRGATKIFVILKKKNYDFECKWEVMLFSLYFLPKVFKI